MGLKRHGNDRDQSEINTDENIINKVLLTVFNNK